MTACYKFFRSFNVAKRNYLFLLRPSLCSAYILKQTTDLYHWEGLEKDKDKGTGFNIFIHISTYFDENKVECLGINHLCLRYLTFTIQGSDSLPSEGGLKPWPA